MNLFNFFIYCLSGNLSLFFSSINPQNNSITVKRKILIFLYASIMSFLIVPIIGQLATPFAIVGVCILLAFHQKNKASNLICFFLGYFLQVCLDYTYSICAFGFFHKTIEELQQNYLFPLTLCYLSVLFILTKLLGWLLHKKMKIETFFSSSKLSLYICINLAASAVIFVFGIVSGDRLGYPPDIVFFNGILFIIYFILSNISFFAAYRTAKKDAQLNTQLAVYENLNSYTQEVERLYHSTRAFKHDYLDILSSMKGYIDQQDMESLSSYFYETILPVNQQMIDSDSRLGLLSYLKDDTVKSVVSAKLMIAMDKGIHVELELRENISITAIDKIDLIRVLGIFLNNAIDAASSSTEKELTIAFIKEEHQNIILIRNSTVPLSHPVGSLCNQQLSSKEGHSGIGLYTAKNILDTYENIRWKLDYKEPYFLVELMITVQP